MSVSLIVMICAWYIYELREHEDVTNRALESCYPAVGASGGVLSRLWCAHVGSVWTAAGKLERGVNSQQVCTRAVMPHAHANTYTLYSLRRRTHTHVTSQI